MLCEFRFTALKAVNVFYVILDLCCDSFLVSHEQINSRSQCVYTSPPNNVYIWSLYYIRPPGCLLELTIFLEIFLVIGAETASSAKSFGVWIWLWGNYTKNEKDHVWTWTSQGLSDRINLVFTTSTTYRPPPHRQCLFLPAFSRGNKKGTQRLGVKTDAHPTLQCPVVPQAPTESCLKQRTQVRAHYLTNINVLFSIQAHLSARTPCCCFLPQLS